MVWQRFLEKFCNLGARIPLFTAMSQPLALIYYERLLPGSQLINRLQDLGYRVTHLEKPDMLKSAGTQKPIVILIDVSDKSESACAHITALKGDKSTAHIPVLAFTGARNKKAQGAAQAAGADLVAADEGVLAQLPQLLEQILHLD